MRIKLIPPELECHPYFPHDLTGLRDKGSDLSGHPNFRSIPFPGDSSRWHKVSGIRYSCFPRIPCESCITISHADGALIPPLLWWSREVRLLRHHVNVLAGSRPYGPVWCGWICGYIYLYKIPCCTLDTEGASFATRSGPTGISV
jgi:hypothetical protein